MTRVSFLALIFFVPYLIVGIIVYRRVYKDIMDMGIRGSYLFGKTLIRYRARTIVIDHAIKWPVLYPMWKNGGKDITKRMLFEELDPTWLI